MFIISINFANFSPGCLKVRLGDLTGLACNLPAAHTSENVGGGRYTKTFMQVS